MVKKIFRSTLVSLFILFHLPLKGQISFIDTELRGANAVAPTSLQFGPDDRLYVAEQTGTIKIFTVDSLDLGNYRAVTIEEIKVVQQIPNYDDDGSLNTSCATCNIRQVTGILVSGTAENPIIYATSSDFRAGAGPEGDDTSLDTNSGILSKLTWNGSSWEKIDMVRGLPRSEENHSVNGMVLSEDGNTLFLGVGGFTNAGAPSNNFAFTSEFALSACIVSIDLTFINSLTPKGEAPHQYLYDLPTVDDPTRTNVNGITDPTDPNYDGIDVGDPFGGNDGLNQARVVAGGPVQIHSSGWRNPYDVIITEAGHMFSVDNGGNNNWGGYPVNEGDANTITNEVSEIGFLNNENGLHYIPSVGYYSGHPNPIRANPDGAGWFTFSITEGDTTAVWRTSKTGEFPLPADWPPIDAEIGANPIEADFQMPGVEDGSLVTFNESANGLCEYTASSFEGEMKGNILVTGFNGSIWRVELDDPVSNPGIAVNGSQVLISGVAQQPLDVIARGDDEAFPGTIWVADWAADKILIFEPFNLEGCTFADDILLDEDGDGFTNADEIDNGTNPCSPASKPADLDSAVVNGFLLSDLNDPDDDEDGILDINDPFAIDPTNGLNTEPNLFYDFFNGDPGTGFFGLGFTGLMINDSTDYLDLFNGDDPGLIAGGTAGLLTIPTSSGDASSNNQENGFQFGVRVDSTDCNFTVRARLNTPIFDYTTGYQPFQQVGMFIGTGDQSDYIKIVVADVEIQALQEIGDSLDFDGGVYITDSLIADDATSFVDLYFFVDAAAGTAQPAFRRGPAGDIIRGSVMPMGDRLATLVKSPDSAMAVGVISTSIAAISFSPTWEFLEVVPPTSNTEAQVALAPNSNTVNASLSENAAIQFTNLSPDNVLITEIDIDLSTTVLPDMVFDPAGIAGDDEAKDFTADLGTADVGLIDSELLAENQGGFEQLHLEFSDFDPSETFGFSIEVDPLSIEGTTAPGPGGAGNISGLELVGATVNVTFSDCSQQKGRLLPTSESLSASELKLIGNNIPVPSIQVLENQNGARTTHTEQTIRITGEANSTVTLFALEGEKLLDPGQSSEPNFANNIVNVQEFTVALGADGSEDTPVTLSRTGDNGGFNYFIAVIQDEDEVGQLSGSVLIILDIDPCEGFEEVGGGTISTVSGDSVIYVCAGNSFISFEKEGGFEGNQAFLLTDENDEVLRTLEGASFDFDTLAVGNYRVYGATYNGNLINVQGQNLLSAPLSDSCYIPSENFITVIKDTISIGQISAVGLGDTIYSCLASGSATSVNFSVENIVSDSLAYVLTNPQGEIVTLLENNSVNFSDLPSGISYVKALAYRSTLIIEPGIDVLDLEADSGCVSISPNSIILDNRTAEGGEVSTDQGNTAVFCISGGNDVILSNSNQRVINYSYVLTDESNVILRYLDNSELDTLTVDEGTYRIHGLSYVGILNEQLGNDVSTVTHSDVCFDLSDNFVTLEASLLQGGTIQTEDGETFVNVCAQEDSSFNVQVSGQLAANYAYLVADQDSMIMQIFTAAEIKTAQLPSGSFQLWGVAYSGNLIAEIDDIIGIAPLSDECFVLSTNQLDLEVDAGSACITSVSPALGFDNVQVYPVPADDQIQVSFHSRIPNAKKTQIELYNIEGRIVGSFDFASQVVGENSFLLDISQLGTGMYFVFIRNGNRSSQIKFIKK